jgi:hypothetical protein
MTAEIVNLRRVRRAKARRDRREATAESMARTGETAGDRARRTAAQDHLDRRLDGARRAATVLPTPANEPGFPRTATADGDDDLDPGTVS